jgi:hypothetical protein
MKWCHDLMRWELLISLVQEKYGFHEGLVHTQLFNGTVRSSFVSESQNGPGGTAAEQI